MTGGREALNGYGALLPTGVSKDVVGGLHAGMVRAMHAADIREKLASHGCDAEGKHPEPFGAFRKAE